MGAVLRLRCWPHAVLPDEAGGRRLSMFLLCHVRGPEGLIVELAGRLDGAPG
jgi:hypothetical protein